MTPNGDGMVLEISVFRRVSGFLGEGKVDEELLRVRVVIRADGGYNISVSLTAAIAEEGRRQGDEDDPDLSVPMDFTGRERLIWRHLLNYPLSFEERRQMSTEIAEFLGEHLGHSALDRSCVVNSFASIRC